MSVRKVTETMMLTTDCLSDLYLPILVRDCVSVRKVTEMMKITTDLAI